MVDLFHWKVKSAFNVYTNSATSMLRVLYRHAPDLIDMVVPVSHLTERCHLHVGYVRHKVAFLTYLDHGWRLVRWSVSRFSSNFVQNCEFRFFVQNARFHDFVRFSSKANFLCPYIPVIRYTSPTFYSITSWRSPRNHLPVTYFQFRGTTVAACLGRFPLTPVLVGSARAYSWNCFNLI